MRSQRSYLDYLRDILQSAEETLTFVEGMDFPTFYADRRTNLSVVRALEIIGEAAGYIPTSLTPSLPSSTLAEYGGYA